MLASAVTESPRPRDGGAGAPDGPGVGDSLYRLAFESNMAPLLFTDRDGLITAANPAFGRLIGRSVDEVIGRRTVEFTFPEDRGVTESSHERLLAGELDEVRYTKRYVHASGRVIDVEVSKSAVRGDDGKVSHFIVAERDVSDVVQRDRFLTLLARVHRLAVVASDRSTLLDDFASALIDPGGFALVWVWSPETGDDVSAPAAIGDRPSVEPLDAVRSSAETRTFDELAATGDQSWRRFAARHGLRSAVAMPVHVGPVNGVVTVFDAQPGAFDDARTRGLEQAVRELELAIAHVDAVGETESALRAANAAYEALTATESALAQSERRFRLAFSENMAPMVFTDVEDRIIDANDAFFELVGRRREEVIGRDSQWITHPEDRELSARGRRRITSGEAEQIHYSKRFIHRTGREVVVDVLKSPVRDDDGQILYFIASELDVTDQRRLAEELLHRALHDPLTGLANRVLFEDRLGQAHERLVRQGGFGAVLLIDLDDFKGVNDTYGHRVGDQLLVGVARRFEMVTRTSDTLGRVGGDEFLYLAENLGSPDEVHAIVQRLLGVLVEPFTFDGLSLEQNATIGVVISTDGDVDATDAIKYADTALYEAKRMRRGHYAVYAPEMLTAAVNRFTLAQSLSRALRSDQLTMHYQPIVSLPNYQVVGFEALMRWESPEEGSVPPSVFIPIAEQSDLIMRLGDFALRHAVRTASTWGANGTYGDQCFVSINLSAVQFRDPGLVPLVRAVLAETGFPAARLLLEITESVAMADLEETRYVVARLGELGVGIALDDFGTGHSSLARLVELQPRMVKVDQTFVRALDDGADHDVLLEAIFTLGHDLGVTMLAEGVETERQLLRLRALGCQLVQGHLFGEPVSDDGVARVLATRPKERLARFEDRSEARR